MKLKKLLFIVMVCFSPLLSYAQGVITIFSEDGDKFYLILNGVKQNAIPQTNVRVDGLTNEYYSGKIVFEDNTKPEITKNLGIKDMASGNLVEATYKIKKTKDGDLKLRFYSFTPVQPNYNPPADMYVAHYGQAPATTTQTTVTTTQTGTNGGGINMNVGAGGLNMNVSVPDANNGNGGVSMNINMGGLTNTNTNVSQTTTTRSTTTTTTTDNNAGYSNTDMQQQRGGGNCTYPTLTGGNFNSALQSIKSSSFDDTKLSTATAILSSNCVSTDQVIQICNVFSFEENKLKFAKAAYSKTTDPNNYFKVVNVFTFDANKTELNNFIANGGR